MGSLSASGIPVVSKESRSYVKRDNRILVSNSIDDSVSILVSDTPETQRPIGSGSIVRDDGTVVYNEEVVWGMQFQSRSSDARIARNGPRNLEVDINDNETEAVIETSLQPDTPQTTVVHTGNRVVRSNSANDTLIDRLEGGRGVAPETP